MEKIRERAYKKYPVFSDEEMELELAAPCRRAYIAACTEQKAIDDAEHTEEMRKLNEEWKENLEIQRKMLIEKACINFCVACPTYENCDTRYNCPMYDKFEKAMEE